jgi:hypothetical protein
MNVYVMVNDYPYNGVCLFIWRTYSFSMMIRKSMLEVDCEVDEPNSFEDDPHDTFEQGKWILPLHILFVPKYCVGGLLLRRRSSRQKHLRQDSTKAGTT